MIMTRLRKFRFAEMILPQPAGMHKNDRGGGIAAAVCWQLMEIQT